jgi:formate hydrogenlyase transcriptional activator
VLQSKLEPELLLEAIARVLRSFVHIDRASLALYDPERDEFEIVALALHEGSRHGRSWSIPHAGSRCGKVFDAQQPYLSPLDPAAFYEDAALIEEGMHATLTLPLTSGDLAIGTFEVSWRTAEGVRESDMDVLKTVAGQVAGTVANSRAYQRVRRDADALRRENAYLLELVQSDDAPSMLRDCPSLAPILERLATIAKVDATVLLIGESGTGKGLAARAIHALSARHGRPFVACDCAALSASRVESELFGQERGEAAGPAVRRAGRFELAHGATIFLDEVAALPLPIQAKLVRVLQHREIERPDGEPIAVDARVIASTSRDLAAEIDAGRFRRDLFERLRVVAVEMPPLRKRRADVIPLAEQFLRTYARPLGRNVAGISEASQAALLDYAWPGNVRELENVIERAVLLHTAGELVIGPEVLPLSSRAARELDADLLPLDEVEARHIRAVLRATRGRISGPHGAARILGLNASTLRSRIAKLAIEVHRD